MRSMHSEASCRLIYIYMYVHGRSVIIYIYMWVCATVGARTYDSARMYTINICIVARLYARNASKKAGKAHHDRSACSGW